MLQRRIDLTIPSALCILNQLFPSYLPLPTILAHKVQLKIQVLCSLSGEDKVLAALGNAELSFGLDVGSQLRPAFHHELHDCDPCRVGPSSKREIVCEIIDGR